MIVPFIRSERRLIGPRVLIALAGGPIARVTFAFDLLLFEMLLASIFFD